MFGKIKITDFGKRHFDPKFGGTKITDKTPEGFEIIINSMIDADQKGIGSIYIEDKIVHSGGKFATIIDGYAPFCKLISIENFTNARVGSMKIDISNYQYIRHGYSARTDSELPVLSRWLELPLQAPVADYLIIVLYSKEQLDKEEKSRTEKETSNKISAGMRTPSIFVPFGADFGVVAILGQTHSSEEPLQPITIMRNALGIEEGGSGFPLNKEKYLKSVNFWSKNIIVKS